MGLVQNIEYVGGQTGFFFGSQDQLLDYIKQTQKLKGKKAKFRVQVKANNFYHKFPLSRLGVITRYNRNINAINTLHSLQASQSEAIFSEQQILAQYVGWGGCPNAFETNTTNKKWLQRCEGLSNLLTDEQYKAARQSTISSFFTPDSISAAIYAGLEAAGVNKLKNGEWLDTSAGVGGLLRTMPESIASNIKLTLIEKDDISSLILEQLYPDANHHHCAFEQVKLSKKFNVVMQNPPFGSATIFDKEDSTFSGLTLHNYFLAKSASLLDTKGWMIALVSSSFMDAKKSNNRQLLSQYVSLKAAVRLPKNVFEVGAGANATVDLLVFEQGGEKNPNPVWLGTDIEQDKQGNDYSLNQYYIDNPTQLVGTMVVSPYVKGNNVHCIAGDDFEEKSIAAIARTFSNLKYSVQTATKTIKPTAKKHVKAFSIIENFGTKEGSFAVGSGNKIYQLLGGTWVATSISGKAQARLIGLCGVRFSLMKLLEGEQNDYSTERLAVLRKSLTRRYNDFVSQFGFVHDAANQRVCKLDPTNYNLLSLERDYSAGVTPNQAKKLGVNVVQPTCKKAEIFTQRVMFPWKAPTSADSVQDALLASLNVYGKVDINYCSDLLDMSVNSLMEQADGELIFNDAGKWVTKNVFQSGNIKTKISMLHSQGLSDETQELYLNALNEVVPMDVNFEDIAVKLGASWIPANVYEEFANNLCGGKQNRHTKIEIRYISNEWYTNLFNLPHSLETSLGTVTYPFSRLLNRLMNGQPTQVTFKDSNGKRVIDKEASLENELNGDLIISEWDNFLLNSPQVQAKLSQIFNERFNRFAALKSVSDVMLLPDSNKAIKLREHQLKAVYRGITEGRLLLNHVVGSGKSYSIAAIAHELIRLGLKQRCLIVVPNHLTAQFAAQYLTLYPADQITVLSPDELTPAIRQATLLRLKTGSKIVICPESSFAAIPVDEDIEKSVIASEIEKLNEALLDADKSGQRFTVKNIETRKANLETRLSELANDQRKKGLTISELGIDALICDEAHGLKNLAYTSTRLANVKGTNTPTGSKRAFDWYLKIACLKHNNSNGLGVYLATGTPIANSLLEVYTYSKYLDEESLDSMGLLHIDSWVSAYADIRNDFEISATGSGFKSVTRLRAFNNISQLKSQWSLFTDSVSAKELLEYLPKIEKLDPITGKLHFYDAIPPITGGKPQQIVVDSTDFQLAFSKSLVQRAKCFKSSPIKNDNMLLVMNHAKKSSIDMRLLNPNLPIDESGHKIPTAARIVAKKYHETTSQKGVQIVFLDMGVPNRDGRHCVYHDLKEQLKDLGVEAGEIVYAQSFKTPIAKSELYSKLNSGIFRVVIASTYTLGCGANVNRNLVGITLLDSPYRPCDLEQRLGRGIRQGNALYEANPESFTLDINYLATKNSLDSFLFQALENKQKFITEFHSHNDLSLKTMDDISSTEITFAEMKAQTSGSPLVLEMVSLTKTIQLLEAKRNSFMRNKRNAVSDLDTQSKAQLKAKKMVEQLQLDMELGLTSVKGDQFTYTNAHNQVFTKFSDACNDITDSLEGTAAAVSAGLSKEAELALGSFAGFNLNVAVRNTNMQLVICTGEQRKYLFNIDSSKGNSLGRTILSSINNFIEKMDGHLNHYQSRLENSTDRLEHAGLVSKKDFNETDLLTDCKQRMIELIKEISEFEDVSTNDAENDLNDTEILNMAA